jgi:hypothetical protein
MKTTILPTLVLALGHLHGAAAALVADVAEPESDHMIVGNPYRTCPDCPQGTR